MKQATAHNTTLCCEEEVEEEKEVGVVSACNEKKRTTVFDLISEHAIISGHTPLKKKKIQFFYYF